MFFFGLLNQILPTHESDSCYACMLCISFSSEEIKAGLWLPSSENDSLCRRIWFLGIDVWQPSKFGAILLLVSLLLICIFCRFALPWIRRFISPKSRVKTLTLWKRRYSHQIKTPMPINTGVAPNTAMIMMITISSSSSLLVNDLSSTWTIVVDELNFVVDVTTAAAGGKVAFLGALIGKMLASFISVTRTLCVLQQVDVCAVGCVCVWGGG